MRKLVRLSLERVFHGAHLIPNHKGKCKNLHGHSYRVGISLSGIHNTQDGILVDFGDIKTVIDPLDQNYANNILKFPSAENMSRFFALKILRLNRNITEVTVTVYETETACATTSVINPLLDIKDE
jgi:6-pyruvoyltetrahydropterin/6-carboxytetrahydropterin synthase